MSERKRGGEGPMGKWGRSPYDVPTLMLAAMMSRKEAVPLRGRASQMFRLPKRRRFTWMRLRPR